jgi:hypothetical protein
VQQITDAATINEYAQKAMSGEPIDLASDRPSIEAPPEGVVKLPGGVLVYGEADAITHAEVRELNGFDEEKLGRVPANQPGKLLTTILELGTVKIGDEKATPALLESLLIGDRDALLLGIRIATYGNDLDLTLTCPYCQADMKANLVLSEDIPVRALESQDDRFFEVELKKGRKARVSMPTGKEQKAMTSANNKSTSELNTMLLAACVQSINGFPVAGSPTTINNLGLADREKLISAIADRRIGPQFGEVKLPCAGCEENIDIALSLADLFRL